MKELIKHPKGNPDVVTNNQNRHTSHLKNIGWYYYRYYYKDLDKESSKNEFKEKNDALSLCSLNDIKKPVQPNSNTSFHLITVYPGLLIGTGTSHESGSSEKSGEFKLGLSFDYTSGLPVIPGSSLKGLLRSAFPYSIEKKSGKEEKMLEENYRTPRKEYIQSVLAELKNEKDESIKIDVSFQEVINIEKEIFDGMDKKGKNIPVYKRDIFFDAFPVEQTGKSFLGSDFITPHKDPLKNPLPIQFMKIMPKVKFGFYFKLNDGILTVAQKEALFRRILLDFGIGAKTNVGYGQFTK